MAGDLSANARANENRKVYAHMWENWEGMRYFFTRMDTIVAIMFMPSSSIERPMRAKIQKIPVMTPTASPRTHTNMLRVRMAATTLRVTRAAFSEPENRIINPPSMAAPHSCPRHADIWARR